MSRTAESKQTRKKSKPQKVRWVAHTILNCCWGWDDVTEAPGRRTRFFRVPSIGHKSAPEPAADSHPFRAAAGSKRASPAPCTKKRVPMLRALPRFFSTVVGYRPRTHALAAISRSLAAYPPRWEAPHTKQICRGEPLVPAGTFHQAARLGKGLLVQIAWFIRHTHNFLFPQLAESGRPAIFWPVHLCDRIPEQNVLRTIHPSRPPSGYQARPGPRSTQPPRQSMSFLNSPRSKKASEAKAAVGFGAAR